MKTTIPGRRRSLGRRQHLSVDEFFYFFLRMRKSEVRQTVLRMEQRFPDDDLRTRARRIVNAKIGLAALGGGLLHLPGLFPTLGQALKLAGVVSAGSMLTRMHLYLVLEVAGVFGEDIDDIARVPEMVAVVAATGLGGAAPSLLSSFGISPIYVAPAGALSMATVTQLIGAAAINFYGSGAAASQATQVTA